MTDRVDEDDDSLPPATHTPTHYERLAAEIIADLDRVAAKFPKLEPRHHASANMMRAHLNVPTTFLSTAVVVAEETPEIEKSGALDPADARDTLQYLDAFRAVDDKLQAVQAVLRGAMKSRRTSLAVRSLQVFALARSLARGGRIPRHTSHVANLRRDLGKRGRPRTKRTSEDAPDVDRPDSR